MPIDYTNIEPMDQQKLQTTCTHDFDIDEENKCVDCGISPLTYIAELEAKTCRMGMYCEEHGAVHGAEAEELRKILEAIEGELVGARVIVDGADYVNADDIRCLITDIDACDSLAFVEKYKDEKLEGMSASLKFANSVLEEKNRRIKELEERINTIAHTASKR